jgi:hypothetical protein
MSYASGGGGSSSGAGANSPPKVASGAALAAGDFDGQDGVLRIGTAPDDHEEYFKWNASSGKWIGSKVYPIITTDDAWALDLSRQPMVNFQNAWIRFNGGVGWYRNGPRAFLRSALTLPAVGASIGTINISTNEEPDANGFATAGQVLIRDNLITYTGYTTTVGARALTGCTYTSGSSVGVTLPATYTPVIPYGAGTGGDYGGWGTTVVPLDHVAEMWSAGFRLQERCRTWINGSQDGYAMTVAPYYHATDLNVDFNYPGLFTPNPADGIGFGTAITGPAVPMSGGAGVRIDERGFAQRSFGWTDWVAGTPAGRVLRATLYGKMPAAATDAGEVYGYTLELRWTS